MALRAANALLSPQRASQCRRRVAPHASARPQRVCASSDASKGRQSYQPASYSILVGDACRALQAAIAAGERLVEIEFPPLPSNKDAYKGSSDEFIDANLQLAVAAAKQLSAGGASVQILVPDVPELTRAEERLGPSLALLDGVSFGSLSGSRAGRLSDFFFKSPGSAAEPLTRAADVYLVCNCSAIELPTLQSFVEDPGRCAPTAVVCLFNCELETHRGDLGLPGFPPKSLHNAFLSRILPVFFLRQRAYSKTVNVAPFLLNYSGATFREYPAPWQVLLRTDSGQMACIAERPQRYGLGEAKEEMMAAMGLNTEEEGSAMGFLRRGRTIRTWWEEENGEEKSLKWRS